MIYSTHELAWAAGLFDGEGHTAFRKRARNVSRDGRRVYSTHILDIRQIDRRVLERFAAAVGLGRVYGPYYPKNGRPVWAYAVARFEQVQAVSALLWKWLSPVKRQQVSTMLRVSKSTPRLKSGRKPQRKIGTRITVEDFLNG